MSKKRGKSGGGGSAGVQRWQQALLTTPFCEEGKWQASVSYVVGNQLEDYSHIEALAAVVNSGIRRRFSIIYKNELFNMVRDLGNPKSKKGKEIPANYEVCEPCKQYLDNNEDIPLPLLAKLIKFKLIDIKLKDIKKKEESTKGTASKDKGKKGDKKERGKSPPKGKGGKKTPEPPSPKAGTKLKKRGEEDEDGKYIDDEPDDGPDHYVIMSGFHQPHLISHLSDVGVNVDCIVRLQSEDYSRFNVEPEEPEEGALEVEKDEKQLALEEDARQQKEKEETELSFFWKDILLILQMAVPSSKLHDVARLYYVVKNSIIPDNNEDNELKVQFGTALFEDVACKIYDLMDSKRQWRHYLEDLKLLQVPEVAPCTITIQPGELQTQPSVTPAPTKTDTQSQVESEAKLPPQVDMRYYNDLMNSVPQESVSVDLIMHSMLQQVSATDEDKEIPSEIPKPDRPDGLEDSLAQHITGLAFKLGLSAEEQQALEKDFGSCKKQEVASKQPLLINYNDDVTKRMNHLTPVNGFDPRQAELEMMGYSPLARLQNLPRQSSKVSKDRAARLQELIHFVATGGLTQAEIDRAFKQFVFECLDLTSAGDNGQVNDFLNRKTQSDIPWDDPYPYFKDMIPTQAEEDQDKVETVTMEYVSSDITDLRSESQASLSLTEETLTPSPVDDDQRPDSRQSRGKKKKRRRSSAKSPTPHSDRQKPALVSREEAPPQEETGVTSAGILRNNSRDGSQSSRKNASVRFERNERGELIAQPGDSEDEEGIQPVAAQHPQDVENDQNNAQKRNLDEWCFAEHMQPEVFLQVLKAATYSNPVIDCYYHKKDHSMFVAMHNPHGKELQSRTEWSASLHSNVGFRNYLEHVADSIQDWAKDEEAKYQAGLLAHEVSKNQKEFVEQMSRPSSAKDKKKDRSKSPKKSPSRGKSPSRTNSAERPPSEQNFIRNGSLKAWKIEQDRINAEEEEKERQKNEKRAKSGSRKGKEKEEKKDKRPGSRGSAKSKPSKEEAAAEGQTEEKKEEERYWPFTGFDMGNNLVHVAGTVSTMFPADGAQIKTEKTAYSQKTTSIKSSVLKDGHTFTVHVLDPKDKVEDYSDVTVDNARECQEKAEIEKSEKEGLPETPRSETKDEESTETPRYDAEPKSAPQPKKPCVGQFGSFVAQFDDGLCLALSTYGASGEPPEGKKYVPEPYVLPLPRSPSPSGKEAGKDSLSKGKKGDKNKSEKHQPTTPEPPPTEIEEPKEEVKFEEEVIEQPFQQVFLTCPDGLCLSYYLENSVGIKPENPDQKRLLVRQSYPYKTRGQQKCEAARRRAMEEVSRVVSADGTVVKTMVDGTIQVLYASSTVSQLVHSSPWISTSRASSPQRGGSAKSDRDTPRKGRLSKRSAKKDQAEIIDEEIPDKRMWITTSPTGSRVATQMDGTKLPVKSALVSVASDPATGQSMQTRDDHVSIVQHPDGTTIVEHADGTRITTYYREIQFISPAADAEQTGEDAQPETVLVKYVLVECPGFATLKFECDTSHCTTILGTGTGIHSFVDGTSEIYHSSGGCLRILADGTTVYHPKPDNYLPMKDPNQEIHYIMRHSAEVIIETVDNMGNTFYVQNTGNTAIVKNDAHDLNATEETVEKQDIEKSECDVTKTVTTYKKHAPRFFIVHADGSGTELLRYQEIAEYFAYAEEDPRTAVLMDPLPDHPGVMGLTVLKPYLSDVSQKWLKPYLQESIVPDGLASRDLKSLPSKEVKKEGPVFGTAVGQGLTVGVVVNESPKPPLQKCPAILELRQLLQYDPVTQELREKLGTGLKQYAEYIKARSRDTEDLQLQDPRSEEEKILAADLQATCERTSTDQSSKGPILKDDIKAAYETATALALPSPPLTPTPKRSKADWERDLREVEEEKECRRALREKDVPSYFESEMGKAFLLSQAPDMDALTRELASARQQRDGKRSGTSDRVDTANGTGSRGLATAEQCGDQPSSSSTNSNNGNQLSPSPQAAAASCTPTGRPGNPTPAHATGQGSPAPVRPSNPTPGQAAKNIPDRTGLPTPKEAGDHQFSPEAESPSIQAYPSIPEYPHTEQHSTEPEDELPSSSTSDLILTRSLKVDYMGQERTSPVHIPAYINGGRPGAVPNTRFEQVEEPVRRQIKNLPVIGATTKGAVTLRSMRGFELLPERVDFGVLKEGNTYNFTVHLKNTGLDSCRFKLKQAPPSTGLKVIYKPGPVAAGMKAQLTVEIYAIAAGVEGNRGIGTISHNLELCTETDIMTLPITAVVLTAAEYEKREADSPRMRPGVHCVSNKPPGSQGIIRPRKQAERRSLATY